MLIVYLAVPLDISKTQLNSVFYLVIQINMQIHLHLQLVKTAIQLAQHAQEQIQLIVYPAPEACI